MKCPKENCNWEGTPNLEEVGPHTKATCPKCGSYIKFIGAKELEELVRKTTVSIPQARRLVIQKTHKREDNAKSKQNVSNENNDEQYDADSRCTCPF